MSRTEARSASSHGTVERKSTARSHHLVTAVSRRGRRHRIRLVMSQALVATGMSLVTSRTVLRLVRRLGHRWGEIVPVRTQSELDRALERVGEPSQNGET